MIKTNFLTSFAAETNTVISIICFAVLLIIALYLWFSRAALLDMTEEVEVIPSEEEIKDIVKWRIGVIGNYTNDVIFNILGLGDLDEESIQDMISADKMPTGESILNINLSDEFTIAAIFDWDKSKVKIKTYDGVFCKTASKTIKFYDRVDISKVGRFIDRNSRKFLTYKMKAIEEGLDEEEEENI